MEMCYQSLTFSVRVILLEGVRGGQVFQFEEHVEELEDHLHVVGGLHQHVHHLFPNGPIHHITCQTIKHIYNMGTTHDTFITICHFVFGLGLESLSFYK